MLHSFKRGKEIFSLKQIDASKSEVIIQKAPTLLAFFYDRTYAKLVINDGTKRNIYVGAFVNDTKISLLDIMHFLKIPINYRQK